MFAKQSLAVAVAALTSLAAQAQSTATVYGNVDVAFGRFEDNVTKVESSVLTGSFIGFKGQEDLGGGLKAFFKLESAPALDTGAVAGNFWGRTSEIGLAGNYGTLTGGNSLSLGTRANDAQSPFSVFGRLNGVQNVIVASTTDTGIGAVQANSLTATSSTYSGFSGAFQYGASEDKAKDDTFAAQVNYATGPFAAGFTYTDTEQDALWQLGGSYDFGVAKAFAQVGQVDKADVTFFELGTAVPVSAQGKVLASWTHAKQKTLKQDELSIAYDHALAKRTSVYGGVQYVRVKSGQSESDTAVAIGLRQAF